MFEEIIKKYSLDLEEYDNVSYINIKENRPTYLLNELLSIRKKGQH